MKKIIPTNLLMAAILGFLLSPSFVSAMAIASDNELLGGVPHTPPSPEEAEQDISNFCTTLLEGPLALPEEYKQSYPPPTPKEAQEEIQRIFADFYAMPRKGTEALNLYQVESWSGSIGDVAEARAHEIDYLFIQGQIVEAQEKLKFFSVALRERLEHRQLLRKTTQKWDEEDEREYFPDLVPEKMGIDLNDKRMDPYRFLWREEIEAYTRFLIAVGNPPRICGDLPTYADACPESPSHQEKAMAEAIGLLKAPSNSDVSAIIFP